MVTPELLSINQSTFTLARLISNNFAFLEELLHGFHQRGTTRRACLNLDITNAFDSINWNAVQITLASMGFTRLSFGKVYSALQRRADGNHFNHLSIGCLFSHVWNAFMSCTSYALWQVIDITHRTLSEIQLLGSRISVGFRHVCVSIGKHQQHSSEP